MQGRATYRIPGGVHAPAQAREIVSLTVGASLPEDSLRELQLMVSEVVTNSVMHGECGELDELELAVAWNFGKIRLEVTDPGPGFRLTGPDPDRPGGWGLAVVESLSDRWGIDRTERTRVWFELTPDEQSMSDIVGMGQPARAAVGG